MGIGCSQTKRVEHYLFSLYSSIFEIEIVVFIPCRRTPGINGAVLLNLKKFELSVSWTNTFQSLLCFVMAFISSKLYTVNKNIKKFKVSIKGVTD